MYISTTSVPGVGFAQLFLLVWYLTGHKLKTCRCCLISLLYMMVKPIQMLPVTLIPPAYTTSQLLWWRYLCVFLVLGKHGHGRVICLLLIKRRPASSSSHLRCCWRATHISWEAVVTFSVGWHLVLSIVLDIWLDICFVIFCIYNPSLTFGSILCDFWFHG